ncbi:MAG: antiactivator of flagellar biosynthesis FleN protein [Proteobacteria bacterium]|nr:antiactivator of flagellar biosynthesis FleN protein [Pseudomonadota bacterium]
MADYSDQAEGLRRMLAGPRPRIFTFLSALPEREKNAMLVNLSGSLAASGSEVLLFDARTSAVGVASQFDLLHRATLLEVARQEQTGVSLVQNVPQGFGVARLAHATQQARSRLQTAQQQPLQMRRMEHAFGALAKQSDIVVIDGELGKDDAFPLQIMIDSEIVVQVSNSAGAIKDAYTLVKRLSIRFGRHPLSVLVTGANEREAQLVYDNMARVASRYLATQLHFLGSVPADEHVGRATRLGRTVVDAFPLAGASIAFRRLAGRCATSSSLGSLRLAG